MTVKEQLVKVAEELPSNSTIDDAIEELIFIRKIELGKIQADLGNVIDQKEVESRVKSWQK